MREQAVVPAILCLPQTPPQPVSPSYRTPGDSALRSISIDRARTRSEMFWSPLAYLAEASRSTSLGGA